MLFIMLLTILIFNYEQKFSDHETEFEFEKFRKISNENEPFDFNEKNSIDSILKRFSTGWERGWPGWSGTKSTAPALATQSKLPKNCVYVFQYASLFASPEFEAELSQYMRRFSEPE